MTMTASSPDPRPKLSRLRSGDTVRRLLALWCLTALASACGGDAPESTGEAESPPGNFDTYSGGPPGGVLVALVEGEPDDLNPVTYTSSPAFQAVRLMFRGLARRDSTLSGYQPDLAESWELRPDSTILLRLRRDVRWHDGTPVTADDVVFTIERQREPRTASPRLADVAAVTSATASDSFTVSVKLGRTGPYTVKALLEVVPIPRHLLEDVAPEDMRRAPFSRNPVGNGFFRFARWESGQQLVLEVNPDYSGGRAALDRVVMRFIPDMNASMTELLSGQADLLRLPPDQRQRVDAAPGVELYTAPRVRPAWIAWNVDREPVNDPAVRRAILMSINREQLAAGLFGDVGEPAFSPIPTKLWEHSPGVQAVGFDPEGARRLLEEAGWRDADGDGVREKGGRPLRVEVDYFPTEQWRQDVLVAIQSMIRNIGVDLAPRAYERTTWVNRLRNREFQGSLWGWGWGPGVVGPNAEMVFHSRSIPPAGANFAGYDNPRVDELLDAVQVERDTTRARTLWREIEQILVDDAAYAPLYLDPELFGVSSRIRGVKFRGIEWWEDVPYWYIPEGERLPRDRGR
jgi:peptide/nickel transport system substrate-binding protein